MPQINSIIVIDNLLCEAWKSFEQKLHHVNILQIGWITKEELIFNTHTKNTGTECESLIKKLVLLKTWKRAHLDLYFSKNASKISV